MTARYVIRCDQCGAEETASLNSETVAFHDDAHTVVGHLCGACFAAIDWEPESQPGMKAHAYRFRATQAESS